MTNQLAERKGLEPSCLFRGPLFSKQLISPVMASPIVISFSNKNWWTGRFRNLISHLARMALSQLSYRPKMVEAEGVEPSSSGSEPDVMAVIRRLYKMVECPGIEPGCPKNGLYRPTDLHSRLAFLEHVHLTRHQHIFAAIQINGRTAASIIVSSAHQCMFSPLLNWCRQRDSNPRALA